MLGIPGYSGASLPANGPDPAAATGTLLSLVSSWHGQLSRVPRLVRNKRLYWPLSPALSFLSLTLSILPCFSSPPVLDAGIWSKGRQPELRIRDWSPPLGRELEFWFCSGLISGRAEFQSSLLWRPRPGCLQVAGDVCKATPFAPLSCLLPLLSTWLPFLPLKSLKTWDIFLYSVRTCIWSPVSV